MTESLSDAYNYTYMYICSILYTWRLCSIGKYVLYTPCPSFQGWACLVLFMLICHVFVCSRLLDYIWVASWVAFLHICIYMYTSFVLYTCNSMYIHVYMYVHLFTLVIIIWMCASAAPLDDLDMPWSQKHSPTSAVSCCGGVYCVHVRASFSGRVLLLLLLYIFVHFEPRLI